MDTNTLRRFILVSTLFMAVPLPLVIAMGVKSGDWANVFVGVAFTLGLCLLYWWPLGSFLAWYQGAKWKTWVLGYLLSLPLYFATLALLYPLVGGTFRPFVAGRWTIYLMATPQFYAMVRLLFYFARRLPAWTLRASVIVFAVGVVTPLYMMSAAKLSWPAANDRHVAIVNARLVDTLNGRILDGRTVYIEDGRIEAVQEPGLHPDWPRIDAYGQYLLPGLIDVHTHLQSPVEVEPGFQFSYFLKSMFGDYSPQREAYLRSGITSIRDLGGAAVTSFDLRARIERHQMLGPRLFAAGRLVTSPHGHPVSTIWPASLAKQGAILASDEKSLIAGLERNLLDGPDAVKFVHGTIGRANEELGSDLLAKGIAWSRQHHLISVVHAETPQEFEDAIGAGATGVEHAGYLQNVPQSLLDAVERNHPSIDPTFGEYEMDLTLNKISPDERKRRMECSYQSTVRLSLAGARIVIGTDAPMVRYGSGFHDELAHFIRAGFRPDEILRFATVNNAEYLGKGSELGRIETGYRADLILTKDNPFEKIDTLRQPAWTMREGQVVSGSAAEKK